ncbi:MAG: glycoside hydrolase family 43 protein [Ruminococcus sp.]|nr:glycoside hydrolase family 43 protein [Ruminococcus sp.]
MIYTNPVVKGFYPDPSVCCANGRYYMVCSSFQYFPGVPLFESSDLVNWKQIGHCLTRKSQVMLEGAGSSAGVYAATIRYNDGTFYMVTTNTTVEKNFYITTNDIYGEWSEPIYVDQGGIDPSLYFEDGHAYFMSNGVDEDGAPAILQCEIDVKTGEKLSPSKAVWHGAGGRYLESPHLYKINGSYYIMAAEGGTEYGHMIVYGKGDSVWGPFVNYPQNPVLTNRNLGGFVIQGVGHGDLVQSADGEWFVVHLGFRQIDRWMPYHHLGREVFMTPVHFGENGWFICGNNGTTELRYEISGGFTQEERKCFTFADTVSGVDWCYLRHPDYTKYELSADKFVLHAGSKTLDDIASPTFIALRQCGFTGEVSVDVSIDKGEAGLTFFMDENHHYDLMVRRSGEKFECVLKLNIGDIKHEQCVAPLSSGRACLSAKMDNCSYSFSVSDGDALAQLGSAQTRYLSSEVAGGFTGVMIGLFAQRDGCTAEFTDFQVEYR